MNKPINGSSEHPDYYDNTDQEIESMVNSLMSGESLPTRTFNYDFGDAIEDVDIDELAKLLLKLINCDGDNSSVVGDIKALCRAESVRVAENIYIKHKKYMSEQ